MSLPLTSYSVDVFVQIYRNSLLNRISLRSDVRVQSIVYYTISNDTTRPTMNNFLRLAFLTGWRIQMAPRISPIGLPYFKDMYFETAELIPNCTFYGYANADILFNDGLIETLQTVEKVSKTILVSRVDSSKYFSDVHCIIYVAYTLYSSTRFQ
jgi:hypothetical protein